MSTEEEKIEVPMIQQEFAGHLAKYRVKKEIVDTIAENIAQVGGPLVFEDPEELNKRMITWSEYIDSTRRKQILDHWFAKKGIIVSEEVASKFTLTSTEARRETAKEERQKKAAEGEVWVVRVDDKGIPRITMAAEGEIGISLTEAKSAVEEIRKSYVGEEPLVTFDESTQKHIPNFKSEFVKQNPMIGWAAARAMDRAAAEGTEVDPMDVFIDQMARIEQMKALVGGGKEPETKGTIGELISGVKDLQEMAREGKPVELPNWMTDPVAFIETVQKVTGGERGGADWMTDPAKFIETIRTITGEPKADEGLKSEIGELRQALIDMKEERYKDQIGSLQAANVSLAKKLDELVDYVAEMKRPVTGKTEMDVISEIAGEGISIIKTELPGLRRDIKETLAGAPLPPGKTAEQREQRVGRLRKALETDKEVEDLGRAVFFGES